MRLRVDSKRSKNHAKGRSSSPAVDVNNRNSRNRSLTTRSHKDYERPSPISGDSEVQFQNIPKDKALEVSRSISSGDGAASHACLLRWGEAENLKLLQTVICFRVKNGCLPTPSNMMEFLSEINDWAPIQLSAKSLISKLRNLKLKFKKSPMPDTESSEFDRNFHELSLKAWDPYDLNIIGEMNDGDSVKRETVTGEDEKASKKQKREKKRMDGEEDEDVDEGNEKGSENNEVNDEKADRSKVLENLEELDKDELPVNGDISLLDAKGAGHSYKYLSFALEKHWRDSNLNMDTLYAALLIVDPVRAEQLDEQFREVFVGILKLKMEKNQLLNEISYACLGFDFDKVNGIQE